MARVVVLDDDAAVRNVIERLLKLEGHDVQAFEDAAPALDEVDFHEVDLIVTDLVMPMPGDQLILILQQEGIEVPTIVISANFSESRIEYLRELGVEHTIEKPFEVAKMLELVRKIV